MMNICKLAIVGGIIGGLYYFFNRKTPKQQRISDLIKTLYVQKERIYRCCCDQCTIKLTFKSEIRVYIIIMHQLLELIDKKDYIFNEDVRIILDNDWIFREIYINMTDKISQTLSGTCEILMKKEIFINSIVSYVRVYLRESDSFTKILEKYIRLHDNYEAICLIRKNKKFIKPLSNIIIEYI